MGVFRSIEDAEAELFEYAHSTGGWELDIDIEHIIYVRYTFGGGRILVGMMIILQPNW